VGPRAGLDMCENSRPHRDFFFVMFFIYSHYYTAKKKQLTFYGVLVTSSLFETHLPTRSPDRPARSQSLYRLSYPDPLQFSVSSLSLNVIQ
jgi:hypothetical protein